MRTTTPAFLMYLFAAINASIAITLDTDAYHAEFEAEYGEFAVHLYHTASKYQMWHVFALFGVGALYDLWSDRWSRLFLGATGICFGLGMILFSGGMYRLVFDGPIGPVTFGGLMYMVGWITLAIAIILQKIWSAKNAAVQT